MYCCDLMHMYADNTFPASCDATRQSETVCTPYVLLQPNAHVCRQRASAWGCNHMGSRVSGQTYLCIAVMHLWYGLMM